MSILTNALSSMEDHLPKVISPRAHGYIDYAHSALFLTAGLLFWKRNRRAAIAALAASGFVLVESLLTDYPLGARPLLSFRTHGEMDTAFVPSMMALPRALGFADKVESWFFRGNGIAEAFVVGMTDFSSRRAHAEREGSERLAA